jgi:hypothetical protein
MRTFLYLTLILFFVSCNDQPKAQVEQILTKEVKEIELKKRVELNRYNVREYCLNGVVYYHVEQMYSGGPMLAHKINKETLQPERCEE